MFGFTFFPVGDPKISLHIYIYIYIYIYGAHCVDRAWDVGTQSSQGRFKVLWRPNLSISNTHLCIRYYYTYIIQPERYFNKRSTSFMHETYLPRTNFLVILNGQGHIEKIARLQRWRRQNGQFHTVYRNVRGETCVIWNI